MNVTSSTELAAPVAAGMGDSGRPSLALGFYLLASRLASPWTHRRAARLSGDDSLVRRSRELLGRTDAARPEGRLIWVHAGSVEEGFAILELARRLIAADADLTCLLTTGPEGAADAFSGLLPDRVIHQYAPLETPAAVRRFLGTWRPDLGIWTASHLSPALIYQAQRSGIPMTLANIRLADSALHVWRRWGAARPLLRRFELALAQDDETARRLRDMGMDAARIEVTGSLREGSAPLAHDELARKTFSKTLERRSVWLAASTHPGEEEAAAAAHRIARRSFPDLLMILAPRHAERGNAITADLRRQGWSVAQRSKDEKLSPATDVYVADRPGEMGLWYRLATVSFLGGSLVPVGGHNPYEAAALGSAVLHGPHVFNFRGAYDRFDAAGAAVAVNDPDILGQELVAALAPERSAELAAAAWATSSEGAAATDRVLAVLQPYLSRSKG